MFLLLIAASIIYFILGEASDGITMLIFVIGIISIDIIQEWKTDKTLEALKKLSEPTIMVMINGKKKEISSTDLVPGDIMLISEGIKVPADGRVLNASTLYIDESTLTGESINVSKQADETNNNDHWRSNYCYAGTLVTRGLGTILVEKIGLETEYGKISKDIASAPEIVTPLQNQINKLVKYWIILSIILFVVVVLISFLNSTESIFTKKLTDSILSGITLAMATIPEEFPVILTVFLSIGAWRLAKKNSLIRNLNSVETLGSVSVLCVDKTGTITKNIMKVQELWNIDENLEKINSIMRMSCKILAYDPMEKAIIEYCNNEEIKDATLIKEYSFTDEHKMMGNVWKKDGKIIIVVKGSVENVLKISNLSDKNHKKYETKAEEMSNNGLRVIAIGEIILNDEKDIPNNLIDCMINISGLIGFVDPVRDTVKFDIAKCIKAGLKIVMITGDNGRTASSIAKQIGMQNSDNIITGAELEKINDKELQEKVKNISIFSRVLPEHKMKIVEAFKRNGEVVAMTGDGVNDAPALKYADIGIAIGMNGSEVAREAADLILLDDNFTTIVDTIEDGRKIYDNIKKAVGYIYSIHIPIILSSLIAPLLVSSNNLFLLPIHIVLLELIIDPTCSIILERQPADENTMNHGPRNKNEKLITKKILIKSIIQGFAMFLVSFITYYIMLMKYNDVALARTMGLSIIFISNILLVQVNSYESKYIFSALKYHIKDKVVVFINLIMIITLIIIIYSPINSFMKLKAISLKQLLLVIALSCISVLWYDFIKLIKNNLKFLNKIN
jgi:Ca2+-transporting ATPase